MILKGFQLLNDFLLNSLKTNPRQERKRQASLKGNLEEARAWQRLTFPFPFVHHQSREEIHYPVQILVLRDDGWSLWPLAVGFRILYLLITMSSKLKNIWKWILKEINDYHMLKQEFFNKMFWKSQTCIRSSSF